MSALVLPFAQQATGFDPSFFIMMGLMFVVVYLFMIRPQKKREDTRRQMIGALQKGDRIVTVGGIHGTVLKVEDSSVLAEVDASTKLRIDKHAVASVATKEKG